MEKINFEDALVVEPAKVSILDELPIGSVIDYEGDTVPEGFEEVEETKIIESGSSGGVAYIKYSDGTLIQYFGQSITASENRSAGGLTYYSGSVFVDLPVPFANTNYRASTNIIIANMNYFCQGYVAPVSNSRVQVSFASTGQNESRTIDVILIGRWK